MFLKSDAFLQQISALGQQNFSGKYVCKAHLLQWRELSGENTIGETYQCVLHNSPSPLSCCCCCFYKFIHFICLFLAALGLHCGARASHCGGFSCCGARALGARASVVVARRLSSCGSWAQ